MIHGTINSAVSRAIKEVCPNDTVSRDELEAVLNRALSEILNSSDFINHIDQELSRKQKRIR